MKGLWSRHFPTVEKSPEPSEHFSPVEKPPLHPRERRLICPSCNETVCLLRRSSTDANPNRQFYTCPAINHKFFKWADEVRPDELIDVPNCGGCSAGICRVRREKTGPNAGRILFMCRVKEGEGSCGYRVWQDELETATKERSNESTTSYQSTPINCDDIAPTNRVIVEETNHNDEDASEESPVVNSSEHLDRLIVTSDKMEQSGESPAVDSSEYVDCLRVTPGKMEQPKRSKFSKRPSKIAKSQLNPTHNAEPTGIDEKRSHIMSKVSKAFSQAAQHLKNDLLAQLETASFKDHEAMSIDAEETFAALDKLGCDDQDFKKRVEELIRCAKSMAEIEQSVPRDDSYQRLVKHCCSERMRLDELNRMHAKTVEDMMNKKKHFKDVQEQVSSTLDWIHLIEAELSCFEVEIINMEEELEKNKEILEEQYLRLESQLKEAERSAAEAAFDRAKTLLRS